MAVPKEVHRELMRTLAQVMRQMNAWAEQAPAVRLKKYTEWQKRYFALLDYLDREDVTPGQAADAVRDFQKYTQQVMGTAYWSMLPATIRGALIGITNTLDRIENTLKVTVPAVTSVVREAPEAFARATGRAISALAKPVFPLLIGGAAVGLLAIYLISKAKPVQVTIGGRE